MGESAKSGTANRESLLGSTMARGSDPLGVCPVFLFVFLSACSVACLVHAGLPFVFFSALCFLPMAGPLDQEKSEVARRSRGASGGKATTP